MILNVTLTKKSIKVVTCTIIVKLLHARAHEIGGVGSVMKPQVNSVGFGKITGLPAIIDYIQPPLFV